MLKEMMLIVFILIPSLVLSQECLLDSDDIENLKQHSLEMIKYLDDSFRKLSTSKEKLHDKEGFIKSLLNDFTESCTVEVVNRSGKREHKIEDYLRNVLNKRYKKQFKLVDIDIIKFEIDKMVPIPKQPGSYMIKGSFTQIFRVGTKADAEGVIELKDVDSTVKEFKIVIKSEIGPNGCTYTAKIDNITVKSVKFFKR